MERERQVRGRRPCRRANTEEPATSVAAEAALCLVSERLFAYVLPVVCMLYVCWLRPDGPWLLAVVLKGRRLGRGGACIG